MPETSRDLSFFLFCSSTKFLSFRSSENLVGKRNVWNSNVLLKCNWVPQLLAHGRWFSPGTPASSTTKTGHHDIAKIAESGVKYNKSNQIKSVSPIILLDPFSYTTIDLSY
jgi:hypothetical protein